MDLSWEAIFALIGALVAGYGGYRRDTFIVGIGAFIIGLALFFSIAVAG